MIRNAKNFCLKSGSEN